MAANIKTYRRWNKEREIRLKKYRKHKCMRQTRPIMKCYTFAAAKQFAQGMRLTRRTKLQKLFSIVKRHYWTHYFINVSAIRYELRNEYNPAIIWAS